VKSKTLEKTDSLSEKQNVRKKQSHMVMVKNKTYTKKERNKEIK